MTTNSKEYSERYYVKNRDKMLENARIKTKCEICGSVVTKHQIKRHLRSPKCKNYSEQIERITEK